VVCTPLHTTYRPGGLAVKSKGEGAHPQTPGNEDPNSVSVVTLPDCFEHHNAPESVRVLFERWARRADESDNGRIEIRKSVERNPATGNPYSPHTVTAAIKWLTSHKLLMLTKRSRGGRGCGGEWFVRWSFTHEGLRTRQRYQNMQTRQCESAHIEGVLEEGLNQNLKTALQTQASPSPVSHSATPSVTDNQRRWVYSQLRKGLRKFDHPTAETLLAGMGRAVILTLRRGDVRRGDPLQAVLDCAVEIARRLDRAHEARKSRRAAFAWAHWVVNEALDPERQRAESIRRSQRQPGTSRGHEYYRGRGSGDVYANADQPARQPVTTETKRAAAQPGPVPNRFEKRRESAEGLDALKGSEFERLSDVVRAMVEPEPCHVSQP